MKVEKTALSIVAKIVKTALLTVIKTAKTVPLVAARIAKIVRLKVEKIVRLKTVQRIILGETLRKVVLKIKLVTLLTLTGVIAEKFLGELLRSLTVCFLRQY